MKRVKVYKPKLQNKQVKIDGKNTTIIDIVDKKHEFLSERGVMDRTLAEFENFGDDAIIARKVYMEEVVIEKPKSKGGRPKKSESIEDTSETIED